MAQIIDVARSLEQMQTNERNEPPPIWIVGSGMTVPTRTGEPGVPGTRELCKFLIESIKDPAERGRFESRFIDLRIAAETRQLEPTVKPPPSQSVGPLLVELYHDVCASLHTSDRLEPSIRKAVVYATEDPQAALEKIRLTTDELERSVGVPGNVPGAGGVPWHVRSGIRALVRFIVGHPAKSGHAIVTTNFDPLISVAFNEDRIPHVRFSIDRDYPIDYIAASVPVVYHVHGYWARGKLLNLKGDLSANTRAKLGASLNDLLRGRHVYVLGYSGWDDVVMHALSGALAGTARVDWLCHSKGSEFVDDKARIEARLGGGSELRFVEGVDGDEYSRGAASLTNPLNLEIRALEDRRDALRSEVANLQTKVDLLNDLPNASELLDRLKRIEASATTTQAHARYSSEWLQDARYSVLNGLRPPVRRLRYPNSQDSAPNDVPLKSLSIDEHKE
jgi:hypothetical protein